MKNRISKVLTLMLLMLLPALTMSAAQYKLHIKSNPSVGGYVYGYLDGTYKEYRDDDVLIEEGTSLALYVSHGYDFLVVGWFDENGNKVSDSNSISYVMPSHDASLTFEMKYAPGNPGTPKPFYYDEENHELQLMSYEGFDIYYTVNNAMDYNKRSEVQSVVVMGTKANGFYSLTSYFENVQVLDFSRTDMDYYYVYSNTESLAKVVLPSTMKDVSCTAFEGSSLNELVCYAEVPPVVSWYGEEYFSGISKDLIVYVPASSISLYESAAVWRSYTILPITDNLNSITVMYPEDVNPAKYANFNLRLQNTVSGVTYTLLTNEKQTSYTFQALPHNTEWNASLVSPGGVVYGSKDNIKLLNEDVTAVLDILRSGIGNPVYPQSINLTVMADGKDVTDGVNIKWYNKADDYLTTGRYISVIMDGDVVTAKVEPQNELAALYAPQTKSFTASDDSREVTMTLEPLPGQTVYGLVLDNVTKKPIEGAVVYMTQNISEKYSSTQSASAGADGKVSFEAVSKDLRFVASAPDHIDNSLTFNGTGDFGVIYLEPIVGKTIDVKYVHADCDKELEDGFEDSGNVAFSILHADGTDIMNFVVQNLGKQIVLMEPVSEGEQLMVNANYVPGTYDVTLVTAPVVMTDSEHNVTITLVEHGGMVATTTDAPKHSVAIVFNADGTYYGRASYAANSVSMKRMPSGKYTIVSMVGNDLVTSITSIAQLSELGLKDGEHYMLSTFEVERGKTTHITVPAIPSIEEKIENLLSINTSFTANKPEVTIGQYETLTAALELDAEAISKLQANATIQEFLSKVSNVNLIIDLDPNCKYINGTLIVGKDLAGLSIAGNRLTIPLANFTDRVRFCVTPTVVGDYSPAAFIQFDYEDKTFFQPVGTAHFVAKNLSIEVPAITAKKSFTARGVATANSYVDVKDAKGNILGQTKTNGVGKWSVKCTFEAEAGETIYVHADITTKDDTHISTTVEPVIYDPTAIEIEEVEMSHFNEWYHKPMYIHWTLDDCIHGDNYYYYYKDAVFTFKLKLSNNSPEFVGTVVFDVLTSNGSTVKLSATHSEKSDCWIATGSFTTSAVPVNVRVSYVLIKKAGITIVHEFCPVTPIHDPSGFVYEAVPSNRLQGVEATIYYRHQEEDVYGDLHDVVTVWDAENYGQENPLYTDESGMYQWDVPEGMWQVVFEADGYETAKTEWLPVPPPQLEINIPMVSHSQPEIASVKASDNFVEIAFSKYMDISTLDAEHIFVTVNGVKVDGTILLVDAEDDGDNTYASVVRFVATEPFAGTEAMVFVSSTVKSYAGVGMQNSFSQAFPIKSIVTSVDAPSYEDIEAGLSRKIKIQALPLSAAANKTISVTVENSNVAYIEKTELALDENGCATLTVYAEEPGTTVLNFSTEDGLLGYTVINVSAPTVIDGISEVTVDTLNDQRVFSISGVQMNAKNLRPGIYVKGNSKFVVK